MARKSYVPAAGTYPKGMYFARLEWEVKNGEFSMMGEVKYRDGGSSGGQNIEEIAKAFPHDEKIQRMCAIWKRWHLNHMKAGCAHQRATWDISKEVVLTHYKWTTKWHALTRKASNGEMERDEYELFCGWSRAMKAATLGLNSPKYETEGIKSLIEEGWLEVEKRETKRACNVNFREHPEGLLSKPCEVCGYEYGTAWLKEELPAEVLAEIESW